MQFKRAGFAAWPIREGLNLVDDVGIHQQAIPIGEGQHRVQVHRGPQLGHGGDDHPVGGVLFEQRRGELADRLARGPLAHADQHGAVADRHHVATLKRGQSMVVHRVSPPHVDTAGKVGMEAIDRGREDGFLMARRPIQWVERNAAIDPACGITRVERVGQWRQQVFGDAGRLFDQRQLFTANVFGKLFGGKPPDKRLGQLARRQRFQIAAYFIQQAQAKLIGHDLVVEDPCARFGQRHGLGQQIVHLHDVDATVAHLVHEIKVIALGVIDPQHVVKQQRVAVRRRQPLMRAAWCAHHDFTQHAHFRMHAKLLSFRHDLLP